MSFDSIRDWASIRSRLRGKYPNLTNKDLTYTRGGQADFLQRLHERTGETKDKLRDLIESDENS